MRSSGWRRRIASVQALGNKLRKRGSYLRSSNSISLLRREPKSFKNDSFRLGTIIRRFA
jgi:hypothetical protein